MYCAGYPPKGFHASDHHENVPLLDKIHARGGDRAYLILSWVGKVGQVAFGLAWAAGTQVTSLGTRSNRPSIMVYEYPNVFRMST